MSDKKPVLVLAKSQEPQFAKLKDIHHIIGADTAAFGSSAAEAEVLLNWNGSRAMLRTVFDACPKLRWVHSRSAGLDAVLFPELVQSSVTLTNGKGVFSQSLGEFVLGAVLYFAKDFARMRRNQIAGVWSQFEVEEIAGQTAGILGYGDIGRAIATRLHAMGMRILATKRSLPDEPDPLIAKFYPVEDRCKLIAKCDYVIVAAPLTPETHHLVSDAEFAAMKPSAVVINVGRGPVIDERPLLKALKEKTIKGAGLDVFETEPLPAGHPFYQLDNLLLSPHCADNTTTWLDDAMRFFIEQYGRFEKSEPLRNVVEKKQGY
ncbi:D-2-hydroxyacid dehydrogenase [Silvibacterium acidisoli]|uniref:D-2-hydroxyacid dehydrogenase n=1 Tax=Acidobacteriaceae bacterium ZG23-2 TaxID=2883246 RepID=UPI00406C764B